MFINPQFYFVITISSLFFYWSIPRGHSSWRAVIVLVFSAIAVASVSLAALLLCLLSSIISFSSCKALAKRPTVLVLTLSIASQICIMIFPIYLSLLSSPGGIIVSLGIAYFTLKSISTVVDGYKFQKSFPLIDILTLNLFFPIYSAGPIERVGTLSRKQFDVEFDLSAFIEGVFRIFVGVFKYYFIAQTIVAGHISAYYSYDIDSSLLNPGDAYILIILKWCLLYLFFSGYTDIAIGASRLFNVKIRENFNNPFLATNIQDYWQRWHMSLMNFMSEYVYLAFVRRTGARILGIGIVFLAAGMWHHLSVNYLIWGCLHGAAMMSYLYYRRRVSNQLSFESVKSNILYRGMCWWLTMSFVFLVSAIGTSATSGEALWIVRSLFHIH